MSQDHEHDFKEVSPGYYECACGATRLVSKGGAKHG